MPTREQRKLKEVVMLVLDPKGQFAFDVAMTSPDFWCKKANITFATWQRWLGRPPTAETTEELYGDAFLDWLFDSLAPIGPGVDHARTILFWRAVERALHDPKPNASVLKLYADLLGLEGAARASADAARSTVDEVGDLRAALVALGPEVLAAALADATARDLRRRTGAVDGAPANTPTVDVHKT